MNIGIIATEFPPASGGMQAEAFNLALCLAQRHRVRVFTRFGNGFAHPAFEVLPILHGDVGRDADVLRSCAVDGWLAANAGYAALAGRVPGPMVVCCNGNDFLSPWVIADPALFDRVERWPWIWRHVPSMRQAWRRQVLGAGLGRAAAVFAISRNTRDLVARRFGISAGRISVIHPGVEDRFFQHRPALESGRREPGTLNCLTVARLDSRNRRKNIDGVLQAVARSAGQIDIRYTVVGDGDDRLRLEALARKLGVSDRVRFTGRLDDAQILAAYAEADLFVLPVKASATDVEGFGIVYVEANAGGVPVLGSRTGGAVDAVRDGETGILIDRAEPPDIAQGIRRFLDERHRFDRAAIIGFAESLRWPSVAARVEALILSVVADAGNRASLPSGALRRSESQF